MELLQPIVHYGLHFVFPALVAYLFFKKDWKKAWAIMVATMLVDLDHLLATPIFDACRCSIGFHYLHSYYAIVIYLLVFLLVKHQTIRLITLGLLLHMATDYQDCLWNTCNN